MTNSRAILGVLLLTTACRGSDAPSDAPTTAPVPAAPAAETHIDTTAPLVPEPSNPATGSGTGTPSAPPVTRGPVADGRAPAPAPAAADSAARILTSAAERYGALRALQADFTMRLENALLRSTIESAGTLYQKRPDRLLLRFTEPAGDVIVSDGQYFWVYYPSVNAEQVMRSPAAQGGRSGVDLQAQFLGDPVARFSYTLEGTERVAERSAWRMLLVPRERGAGYRSLRVWLDARDYLARRFEITEDNGSVRRFELRNLRINPDLSDSLFRFQPPSGARVISQ